ncbi:MAG: helicase HerA domain-containing protein, partial [Candidatus Heimdallarchaeota archaeon]
MKYLIEINHDFIWQLFFTSKRKNKFYIGSQLSLFIYSKLVNAFSKSIKNNLNNLFSDFYIKLKRPKFPFKKNSILINSIKEHYPYQWYNKPIFIINNYFTLPRATNYLTKLIWEYNTKLDTKNSDTEVRGIPIGYEVVQGLKNPPIVNLSLDDMTSHFSCFGITSQGKSRLMYNMLSLIEKTDKHFLVVDTKGEYLEALSNNLQPIIFYKVGSFEFPLHLNIFMVPPGINRDNHEYFLYSLLSGIMGDDISPQMNRILFKSIKFTVENKGNFQDFLNAIDDPRSLNIKGSYLELSGSGIINRLLPLITGPGKSCFLSKNSNINFFDLINKNVIIDLSQFELIESTIARKVFVNTFLHYFLHSIRFNNAKIRDKGDITNFILIEEIQKIAPIIYQGKNQVNSFIGLAPWTVRAYGV